MEVLEVLAATKLNKVEINKTDGAAGDIAIGNIGGTDSGTAFVGQKVQLLLVMPILQF